MSVKLKYFFILIFFINISFRAEAKTDFHNYKNYSKTKTNFQLREIVKGLNFPWGVTFIDEENLVVTEKDGQLLKININTKQITKIKHQIKSIPFNGNDQGGLLDVLYNDEYLYFSYSHLFEEKNKKKYSSTAIARGKLIDDEIKDLEILITGKPKLTRNIHWGSRIVIHKNHLYASFGERGMGMIAQDSSTHPGSIIRINIDGSIPQDNPSKIDKPKWLPEIFLIGVRNPQGMTLSPKDGKIYFSQHGPRGGDNIGIITKGANFGWKDIAWGGTEYYGAKIGTSAFKKKYKKPIISWVPSIGVGQINFYKGQTFADWNGDMLVSSTKKGLLIKLRIKEDKVIDEEIIINQTIGRIRDFEIDMRGDIYIITDDFNSSLWKLYK